ncbi:MAG: TRAP transporter small permease subunit [Rhodobacterales bacterium]|nr:TRAP transporter small permease subunit [Rhodobacterales bacterium]
MDETGTGQPAGATSPLLTLFAGLVIVLMLAIVAQVVCSQLDINPLATFERALPVLGKAVTLNSLLDLQWHLLAIVALLPAGLVWWHDKHVRVDFIYLRLSTGGRRWVDLVGTLVFTVPFLALGLPAAWDFTRRAFVSGEGSRSGGLNDLFLIKAVLPLGLAVLAAVVVVDLIRILWSLRDR